jgi:hypothetical protein
MQRSYRIKMNDGHEFIPGERPFLIKCVNQNSYMGGTCRVELLSNRYDTIGSIKSFIFENYQLFGYATPPNSISIRPFQSNQGILNIGGIDLVNDLPITQNLNLIIN